MEHEQIRVKKGSHASQRPHVKSGPVLLNTNTLQSPQMQHYRNIGNEAVQRMMEAGVIQGKFTIGQPNDKYEQEANRVADQVMRMPEPKGLLVNSHSSLVQRESSCPDYMKEEEVIQTKPLAEQITPLVQRQVEPEEEEEELIQTKREDGSIPEVTSGLESRIQSLRGGGQPLSDSTRNFFEPLFGADFRDVRLHTDARASQIAQEVNARAFTTGKDVVFGTGQYSPETSNGKKLLAHELTHVIQQKGASSNISPTQKGTTDNNSTTIYERPHLKSNSMLQMQSDGCCCCVESIDIDNVSRIDNAAYMGHSFDVIIGLNYPMEIGDTLRSCTLEWWERTNVPAVPGHPPNTWTDMFALVPNSPTFRPWVNRWEGCETSTSVTINDTPALGKWPGRTVTRTLEFSIVVSSSLDCDECNYSTNVTATQVLTMSNGTPDWTRSSFTTP